MNYKKFRDIVPFTGPGKYRIDVGWTYLKKWIAENQEEAGLELDPDFQRGHVWTEAQQTAYVEFSLRGGRGAREILFNCPGWPLTTSGMVLVDGLQRVTAVLRFLDNEIPAFGTYYKDYEDGLPAVRMEASFSITVNNLSTRAEVLKWYLDLNSGGVVHSQEELDRVRELLKKEEKKNDE